MSLHLQHLLLGLTRLPSQNSQLLRTPHSNCKALTPKQGDPPLHWALEIGKCCPASNLYFSDLPEPCSYEGRVFQDGEDWPLSRCAKCVCRNGAAQCFAAQCQPLFCNQVRKTASEWILPSRTAHLTVRGPGGPSVVRQAWGSRNKKQSLFCFLTLLETPR